VGDVVTVGAVGDVVTVGDVGDVVTVGDVVNVVTVVNVVNMVNVGALWAGRHTPAPTCRHARCVFRFTPSDSIAGLGVGREPPPMPPMSLSLSLSLLSLSLLSPSQAPSTSPVRIQSWTVRGAGGAGSARSSGATQRVVVACTATTGWHSSCNCHRVLPSAVVFAGSNNTAAAAVAIAAA
jgi:hypothetical protein